MIEATVETEDILIERALFPPEYEVKKLERFPPGHEAININPRAILEGISKSIVIQKAKKGKKQNCENIPITKALLLSKTETKSCFLISIATPYMMNAIIKFNMFKES